MKKGKLGPAFHTYLEYLEEIEEVLSSDKPPKKVPRWAMNNDLFRSSQADFEALVNDVAPVDAYLAGVVRSSVKYKMHTDTIMQLTDKYREEIKTISLTTPLRLPFEWTTLILEGVGDDTIIIVAQEQTVEKHATYPELELEPDEPFACLNFCIYKPTGSKDMQNKRQGAYKLSHVPVEMHFKLDKLETDCKCVMAGAGKVEITEEGRRTLDLAWGSFLIWLAQFELQGLLRHKTPGAGPNPGKHIRRHKARKKTQHPQFEHTVIQMEIDAPEPGQAGYSMLQAKRRLHAVRGFWRHYRETGKRVWVKAHWRGDEKLGVIRRDVELVTHEE